MDTNQAEPTDAYNSAIAAIIRARKAELRLTFEALEASSGINLRTLKRLVNDQRPFLMGNFIKLTAALDLDPAEVVQSAASRVEKTSE